MQNWNDLIYKHHHATYYIYGKGPGFHEYLTTEPPDPNAIRLCVNETALHVPDPHYVISLNDETWANLVPIFQTTNVQGLIPRDMLPNAKKLGIPENRLLPFTRCEKEEYLFKWGREEVAHVRYLYCNMGSAVPLVHFAWLTGAHRINFVGFDGGVAYAPEFNDQQSSVYNDAIWEKVIHVCENLYVEPVQWVAPIKDPI